MQKRNTRSQVFRDNATENEWIGAVKDHDLLSDKDFKAKHGFSWSSVHRDAVERGYYIPKRICSSRTRPAAHECTAEVSEQPIISNKFIIPDQVCEKQKISRSVQLDTDIYERLKALECDKGQYTHSAILNYLLDVALNKYGY